MAKTAKKTAPKAEPKPEPKTEALPKAAKPTRKYAPHFTVRVLKTDMKPKRNGRNPYAIYKDGLTVAELLAAGIKPADLWWDSKIGVIEVVKPEAVAKS